MASGCGSGLKVTAVSEQPGAGACQLVNEQEWFAEWTATSNQPVTYRSVALEPQNPAVTIVTAFAAIRGIGGGGGLEWFGNHTKEPLPAGETFAQAMGERRIAGLKRPAKALTTFDIVIQPTRAGTYNFTGLRVDYDGGHLVLKNALQVKAFDKVLPSNC